MKMKRRLSSDIIILFLCLLIIYLIFGCGTNIQSPNSISEDHCKFHSENDNKQCFIIEYALPCNNPDWVNHPIDTVITNGRCI